MAVKVIFHVDENHKWELALKNAGNLLKAVGKNEARAEILANAEAVGFYRKKDHNKETAELMDDLHEMGIIFKACNNALGNFKISKDDIFPFVKIVPVGVLDLALKQDEGYAYIKP
ncbi:DsrE family protein [Breznakiella homolactica]|uniref:DsrE family protein n=1 Tax=Breznakiella homolactica TaxID=2798577 RepID=A0A7T7XPM9_9SPIR|nr:DsrE family protein [Breznakiella homolactica]QQO10078.1 DsrE family protein [Breznakiella homolactica]